MKEAIEIGEVLSAKANDQHIMYTAMDRLSSAYKELGEVEKAVKIANKLPTAWLSKEAELMWLLEGAELNNHSQDFLLRLIGSIGNVIYSLHRCDYDNEQNIQIYKKAIQLIKLFFENGDCGALHLDLSSWYSEIAKNYAEMNDADAVVENLSTAAEHAIAYDLLEENVSHTSLLFNTLKTQRYGKTYMSNESQNALKRMAVEHYDFCRDDERFTEIKNRLTAVACEDINTR